MNQTFTAVDQRSPRITLLGRCTLGINMAGANTLLLQADVAGSWITLTDGSFTASGVVDLDPGGVPLVVTLTQSVHAANTTYELTGNFLADEESIFEGEYSLLTEGGEDLVTEAGNYINMEA